MRAAWRTGQRSGLAVLTWEDLLPEMRQHIQMDNISWILFLGILIQIVAFGILNTILMSVTECFREFGVSLAFLWNADIVAQPIYLGKDLETMIQEYGWLPAMYSTLRFHVFFNSSLAILCVTVLSYLYPAYRVWKLEPIQGMRHV